MKITDLIRANERRKMEETFKQITADNLDKEHICCCISEKKGENCVSSKKDWLRERLPEGLVFNKLDVRGKVFIEYLPAESAWAPIDADGYMYIDCLWVSGQYKGKGYADKLLEQCILDSKAKGKLGLVCISSKKKMPFLSDPGYLRHKGFLTADTASPYFELLYLPFDSKADVPSVKANAKDGVIDETGFALYYSNQCPHTAKYAPLLAEIIRGYGTECQLRRIETREEAQSAPVLFTTYALFYNGRFITNEVLSEKSFAKLWEKMKAAQGAL